MQHLAIIPDGNRRWAVANKMQAILGYKKGIDVVKSAVNICIKNGIKFLSIYTFSFENFNRSDDEKKYLFNLLGNELKSSLKDLAKEKIRVRFIGDSSYFPEPLRVVISELENETKDFDRLTLNLCFCYGSRQEMVFAVKRLAQQVKDDKIKIDDINEKLISDSLWTAGIPDPDLIIRTSDILRLSNFLLYQAAYSELMFLNCYWPEVTEAMLQKCVDDFAKIKRNFGK